MRWMHGGLILAAIGLMLFGLSLNSGSNFFTGMASGGPICGDTMVEPPEVCDPPGSTSSCTLTTGGVGAKTCNATCTAFGTCTGIMSGWWKLDEGSGNTTADSSTSNPSNTGIL